MRKEGHMGFIFAITGVLNISSLIECRRAGFDDFFAKPFSLDRITNAAEQAFESLKRWKLEDYGLL